MKFLEHIARLNADYRYLAAAVIIICCTILAPQKFFSALIGLGLAIAIIGCLPRPTRGTMAAAMLGMAASSNAFLSFATGVFQDPLIAEFHWTRSQYVVALQIVSVASIVALPIAGMMIDRYGIRRVVVPSFVTFAMLVAAMSQMTGRLGEFYFAYALIPFLGLGASSVAFARLVTNWFDKKRGLAFGAVLSGIGIGGATFAPLTQAVIGEFGWRGGYLGIAALEILLVTPLVLLLIKDHPSDAGLGKDGELLKADQIGASLPLATGYTAKEARRQRLFWYMIATFMLMAFAVGGIWLQMFPILTARGVLPAEAATILGAMALSLIVGRTIAGALMDVYPARIVAAVFLLGPIIGSLMLANNATGAAAMTAAILVGLATGAEIDVLAYMVSRYFGVRAFGSNYAWQYAAWSIGSGLGPQLGAILFDRTGSYTTALYIDSALFAVAAVLILRFGPFPDWNESGAKKAE